MYTSSLVCLISEEMLSSLIIRQYVLNSRGCSSGRGTSRVMRHWPPRSFGQVLGYVLGMGVTYAALTSAREALRSEGPRREEK